MDRSYTSLEGIGLLLGTIRWRQLDRPRRFLTAWLGIAFVASMAEPVAKALIRNTIIVAQFWYP